MAITHKTLTKYLLVPYLILAALTMQLVQIHVHLLVDQQAQAGHAAKADMHLAGTLVDDYDAESLIKTDVSPDSFLTKLIVAFVAAAILLLVLLLLSRRSSLSSWRYGHLRVLHDGHGLRPPLRAPPVV